MVKIVDENGLRPKLDEIRLRQTSYMYNFVTYRHFAIPMKLKLYPIGPYTIHFHRRLTDNFPRRPLRIPSREIPPGHIHDNQRRQHTAEQNKLILRRPPFRQPHHRVGHSQGVGEVEHSPARALQNPALVSEVGED